MSFALNVERSVTGQPWQWRRSGEPGLTMDALVDELAAVFEGFFAGDENRGNDVGLFQIHFAVRLVFDARHPWFDRPYGVNLPLLEQRELIGKLFYTLKELGVVLCTVEEHSRPGETIGEDILLPIYLSDGAIHLEYYPIGGAFNRTVKILKMRGVHHGEGVYPYIFARGIGIVEQPGTTEMRKPNQMVTRRINAAQISWKSFDVGLLVEAFVPEGDPLVVGIDETLERGLRIQEILKSLETGEKPDGQGS